MSLHDERGIVSGESFPYEANDFWTYRLSGQALRGALDLAVGWADPQETLLRPQGSTSRWMTAWKRHTDDKAILPAYAIRPAR